MERYIRQIILPEVGEDGQKRLAESSVLIIGLGGLGAPVSIYLTASGIGRIGLVDLDTVSESNLQRQILYNDSQIGLPKVECAEKRLVGLLAPGGQIDTYGQGLTPENADGIIADYDVVMDCTDNFSTRLLIDEACARVGKPWVHGSIDGFVGQVTIFNYKENKRYRDLYPDAEALAAKPRRIIGTFGITPGTVGSLQAAEALKLLLDVGDLLDGKLLTLNLLNTEFNVLEF